LDITANECEEEWEYATAEDLEEEGDDASVEYLGTLWPNAECKACHYWLQCQFLSDLDCVHSNIQYHVGKGSLKEYLKEQEEEKTAYQVYHEELHQKKVGTTHRNAMVID